MASQGDGKMYLYNAGDECTALTGGWRVPAVASNSTGSKNKLTDRLQVIGSSGSSDVPHFETTNAVDLSAHETLKAVVNYVKGVGTGANGFISIMATANQNNPTVATKVIGLESTSNTTLSIDISDLSGAYYIDFGTYLQGTFEVFSMWLE